VKNMSFLDKLTGKKEESKTKADLSKQTPEGKYSEACSFCGNPGSDKKWMGQYWHTKCLRSVKKGARKML